MIFAELIPSAETPQLFLLAVAAVASSFTPFMAYKFRERRNRRPKTSSEKLYHYYENYIDRLEEALAKKDILIEKLSTQLKEQKEAYEAIIEEMNQKIAAQIELLGNRQAEIEALRADIEELQAHNRVTHKAIERIKAQTTDIEGE